VSACAGSWGQCSLQAGAEAGAVEPVRGPLPFQPHVTTPGSGMSFRLTDCLGAHDERAHGVDGEVDEGKEELQGGRRGEGE